MRCLKLGAPAQKTNNPLAPATKRASHAVAADPRATQPPGSSRDWPKIAYQPPIVASAAKSTSNSLNSAFSTTKSRVKKL